MALFKRYSIEDLDKYLAKKDYKSALKAIAAELKRHPGKFNLLLRQADILAEMGAREDAVSLYQRLAKRFLEEGHYPKAIALYKKIAKLEPSLEEKMKQEIAEAIERHKKEQELTLEQRLRQANKKKREDEQVEKIAEASKLFAAFGEDTLHEVLSKSCLRSFSEGDIIVTEGQPGHSMFLIVSGKVKVFTRAATGEHIPLAELGPGDFFGEVSILTGKPRTATITAMTPVVAIELTRRDVEAIAKRNPHVLEVLQKFYEERAEATVEAVIAAMRASRSPSTNS